MKYLMDPMLKDKWVKAMRSGKYQHGRFSLRRRVNNNKYCYCPMGILINIYTGRNRWIRAECGNYGVYTTSNGLSRHKLFCTHAPMGNLAKELGISPTQTEEIIQLNDFKLRPLNEIADWIEDNIPCRT